MLITYSSIPSIKNFGNYYGFLDRSKDLKFNKKPIVRIGGVAIFFGFNLSLILLLILSNAFIPVTFFLDINIKDLILPFLLCSSGFFLIGFRPVKRIDIFKNALCQKCFDECCVYSQREITLHME